MQEAGESTISQRRLAAALSKTQSIIRQVDQLLQSDFPHRDSQQALTSIKRLFERTERQIIRRVRSPSGMTAGPTLGFVTEDIEQYTEILGFILRSTNTRNPFEVYYPLKRLATQILGEKTMLLISSEWDFIPFTYPMNIDYLPNLVMIGTPAPESDNPFLIPLAGHEIGHSAWRKYNIFRSVDAFLTSELENLFDSDVNIRKFGKQIGGSLLAKNTIIDRCSRPMQSKSEEVFCDLTGLYIFGASYIYAFDYLLSPGSENLSQVYPNALTRIQILRDAAKCYEIPFDLSFVHGWSQPGLASDTASRISEITDKVVYRSRDKIIDLALKFFKRKNIKTPRRDFIRKVRGAFEVNQPYDGKVYLSEIVSAGWERILNTENFKGIQQKKEMRLLKELVFKSIEVAEFRARLSE